MTRCAPIGVWVDAEPPLLTSRGAVLFYIALNQDPRLRVMARDLGLTERRVTQVVKELNEAGLVTKYRTGRRNQYAVTDQEIALFPSIPLLTLRIVLSAIRSPPDA